MLVCTSTSVPELIFFLELDFSSYPAYDINMPEEDDAIATAAAAQELAENVPNATGERETAEFRREATMRETMQKLEAARDRLSPYCISVGEDAHEGWGDMRKIVLLAEPTTVKEGEGESARQYEVWTTVSPNGFYGLRLRSPGEGETLPAHIQARLDGMHKYVTHAQRYLDGVDQEGGGLITKSHISFFHPKYEGDRNPNAPMESNAFYLDRDEVVKDMSQEAVLAAIQANIDHAAAPLLAARDAADRASDTAGAVNDTLEAGLANLPEPPSIEP